MIHSCSEERKMMILWSLCLIFALSNSILVVIASPSQHLCLLDQRDALWEFKNEFYVHSDVLSSDNKTEKWRYNTDCCSWDGVSCDPKTGKIVELDLMDSALNGPLRSNSSLFRLQHLQSLDLRYNNFSGILPDSIANLKYLSVLRCTSCNLHGEIPSSLGNLSYLADLGLSVNDFTSEGPNLQLLLPKLRSLISIDLEYNQFKEESISLGLRSLDVGHNQLSGELPKSLINCTDLQVLNVEGNKINDTFPFGVSLLSHLEVLVLRSNEFHGSISPSRDSFSFPNLRIFDISENHFSGVLPSYYFVGWKAVSSVVDVEDYRPGIVVAGGIRGFYHNSVVLTNKGLKMELVGSVFTMYKTIDVSRNRFEGDIPESIGLLKELIVLNMSYNAFTGHIPQSLTNLTNLQSLDLSQNRLSGEIPPQLGKLTFLERMNFSYNRLEGPIPQGTQIQSQNSSSFAENPGLCGAPLEDTCGGGGEEEATKQEQDEEKEQVLSWTAAAIAYVPGVVCGLTIAYILTS
ncbi:hypothetical protein AALP_AAs73006U000200 [Arabis alpina]|uniref:Leucine-rich repeat-containing N-terminal plant-type domain-containing protein n=1 Tax=Arabis alpina TaxID=50452 RepID=A0A087G0X8_ARAAL|nr:hypothetical protein AALP_AAs73006U000200 [Arabis alpina]